MSCANSTPPVSIQNARSTPWASICGNRCLNSAIVSSVIDLSRAARVAAERAAQSAPLPVSASVPVAA